MEDAIPTAVDRLDGTYSATKVRLTRPRLLRELVIVPLADGCLIDGSAAVRVLKGSPKLQELLVLLDGNRTLEQVRAILPGMSSDFLDSLLAQLSEWGLLYENVDDGESLGTSNADTLSFFRRFCYPARDPNERFEKLNASSVVIFARQSILPLVQTLKTVLENTGVGRVVFEPTESAARWLSSADMGDGTAFFVSLSLSADDRQWFSTLDQWCRENNRSWFRFVVDPSANYADAGPLFDGKSTPCYRCFHDVHGKIPSDKQTNAPSSESLFWVSMAAAEIVFRLAQIRAVQAPGVFRRYDLQQWDSTVLFNTRVPGCEQCRPCGLATNNRSAVIAGKVTDTALVFEDYIAPKGSQFLGGLYSVNDSYAKANPHEGKELSNCPTYALPRLLPPFERPILDVMSQNEVTSSGSDLSAKDLATLLLVSAGLREPLSAGPEVRRWAPSGGNFGSVEPFVLVRHVKGLSPGLYFYQANGHSLKLFERHRGSLPVDEFMRRALRLGPGDTEYIPDALIILTGAFGRLATKYGAFAYKLINLDAGAAIGQLCLAAAGLNISLQVASYWADDVIEEQLNLRKMAEQSTALVTLSGKVAESVFRCSQLSMPSWRSRRSLQDFSSVASAQLVEMLYDDSRLTEAEIRTEPVPFAGDKIGTGDRPQPTLPLPPPLSTNISLRETFANRRSVRNFAPRPVSLEQLGTMLYLASDFEIKNFTPDECEAGNLTFLVFALQVDGLAQGAYVYDRRSYSLSLLSEIQPGPQYAKLFGQPELAAAPLFVWVAGDLAAACAGLGAFGHRRLLMRAGATAHALSMAALGLGLAGAIIAGVIPGGGHDFGIDGYKRASLVGFLAGYENPFSYEIEPLEDFGTFEE